MTQHVSSVPACFTYEWLTKIHYAKRIPPISYAFGLYDAGELYGVVTYGTPSSAPLRSGIAGEHNSNYVIELNRLVFKKPLKNGASKLIGESLRRLPKPSIVVSYADTEHGHIGYVYQACNFLYTGLSAKRTDWKIKGMEHLHPQTIADISKSASGHGRGARANFMKNKYGDDFYLEDRPRKHRYIYICANKNEKKKILSDLKYPIEPYPKGDSARYAIEHNPAYQALLF